MYWYSSVIASFHTGSLCCFSKTRSLSNSEVAHDWRIDWKISFFFLRMCLEKLACFSASCIVILGRHFMPCCNITEHINWSNWINWNNVFLPLNCWRGRRYSFTVNLHLRFFGYLKDYLIFKDNVSACLNLSLTRDVDLECLWRFTVSFLSKGSSLDFFSLGTWRYTGHPNNLKCSISSFTLVKAYILVKTLVLNIYCIMHAFAHEIIERFWSCIVALIVSRMVPFFLFLK